MSGFGMTRSLMFKFDGKGVPYKPTINPTSGFSASADAERLHRAMRGVGTDEKTIIQILAHRTNYERQEICKSYQSMHNKSLKDALKGDTSGSFCKVLKELVLDCPYMLAKSLYYAMKDAGTNERVLIEILPTLWNEEMAAVAKAYKQVLEDKGHKDSKHTLEHDVEKETSGDFQYALLGLVRCERDDIPPLQLKAIGDKGVQTVINLELAEADAKELHAAGAGRMGTSEKRLSRVIVNRTPYQLCATAETYQRLYNKPLLDDIKSETSGDYRRLLVTILRMAIDRPALIAEWLHDSMAGLGTRDYALMRLLITRSEIDLENVKQAYAAIYGETLEACVQGDTSGDYKETMLGLLGC